MKLSATKKMQIEERKAAYEIMQEFIERLQLK